MEKPLDGMNSPSEVGQRLIDQPEHPPQGVAYASEVNTEMVHPQRQERLFRRGHDQAVRPAQQHHRCERQALLPGGHHEGLTG